MVRLFLLIRALFLSGGTGEPVVPLRGPGFSGVESKWCNFGGIILETDASGGDMDAGEYSPDDEGSGGSGL